MPSQGQPLPVHADRKVVEELVGLSLKNEALSNEVKGLRSEFKESVNELKSSLHELSDFISGNKNPERGLIVQVDRLRGDVARLETEMQEIKRDFEAERMRSNEIMYGSKPGEGKGIIANVRDSQDHIAFNRRMLWAVISAFLATVTGLLIRWLVLR